MAHIQLLTSTYNKKNITKLCASAAATTYSLNGLPYHLIVSFSSAHPSSLLTNCWIYIVLGRMQNDLDFVSSPPDKYLGLTTACNADV